MAGDIQCGSIVTARRQVAAFELIGREEIKIDLEFIFADRIRIAVRRSGRGGLGCFGLGRRGVRDSRYTKRRDGCDGHCASRMGGVSLTHALETSYYGRAEVGPGRRGET